MHWIRSLLAGCAFALGSAAGAADVAGLYEAAVAPTLDPSRETAFVEAFRMVAIKVSGMRGAVDRLSLDVSALRSHVQLRAPRADGSVTIRFEDAWVDRTLTSAGLPLWGRERPNVLVWLSVPDASGRPTWLAADQTSPEREALDRVAVARGLPPIIWPVMDTTDQATVATLGGMRGSAQALLASGERYRADGVLFGVASRDAAGGSTVRWSFALQGENDSAGSAVGELQASLEEGVQIAADRSARLFAVVGGTRSDVSVSVNGIHNLDAYAGALSYLQGLTVVLGVAVEQLQADAIHLRVAVRGDATTLKRAVELKRRTSALVVDNSVAAAPGDGTLRLRYLQ